MESICRHFIISGKVQDVWYRASTQKIAQELNITGWVKNTPDGHVEVFACGEKSQLNNLENWLWKGPELANVSQIVSTNKSLIPHDDFTILEE